MSCISCNIESYSIIILVDSIKSNCSSVESGSNCTVNKVVVILCACCCAVLVSIFVDAVSYGKNEFCFVFSHCEVSDCCVECSCCFVNLCLACFSLTENFLCFCESFFVSCILISIKVAGIITCLLSVCYCFTKLGLIVGSDIKVSCHCDSFSKCNIRTVEFHSR